jgi:hypothetical protein
MSAAESLDAELESFRAEARDWLAKNFPPSLANVDVAMASAMAGSSLPATPGFGRSAWERKAGARRPGRSNMAAADFRRRKRVS